MKQKVAVTRLFQYNLTTGSREVVILGKTLLAFCIEVEK